MAQEVERIIGSDEVPSSTLGSSRCRKNPKVSYLWILSGFFYCRKCCQQYLFIEKTSGNQEFYIVISFSIQDDLPVNTFNANTYYA